MACCQERSSLFFLSISLILFDCLAAKGYAPVLKDFPTTVFQRHLKVSRHHPVCVVFRKTGGVGSKLEKTVFELWQNKKVSSNYTSWEFGAFDLQKDKLPPKAAQPKKLPSVRCYLGETSEYNYQGKADKTGVGLWLYKLRPAKTSKDSGLMQQLALKASLHTEQSMEVTPELLKDVQKKFKIVLIAFPDGPRHHEVEDMVYKLASELESCKALAVHLNSAHVKTLREKYGFSKYPSVVVIHNKVIKRKGVKHVVEDFRVFSHVEVNQHVLEVYIMAHSVLAPFLSMDDFKELLKKNASSVSQFRPLLVCFYAYWAEDVKGYIYAFNSTVIQYRIDRVRLRYGLVDLTASGSNEVIREYVKMGAMNQVPFLVLYYKDKNDDITSTYLHTDRPYPWILYNYIEKVQDKMVTLTGVTSYEPPWGTITFDQFSSLKEGPNGSLCTPWSSNLTDSNPYIPKPVVKKVRVHVNRTTVVPKPKSTWHDKFDTDSIERQLSSHNGIPLLTQETWSKVVEKSHAPRHIFYKSGKWAGEVTKVSLVVFIMADCGNCKRNNQTFKNIQRAVSHVDGGAMYYVNCTAEKELCATHNIRGFPIISAFRGLGWMDVSNTLCLSTRSKSTFRRFVRLDYHGVIKADFIMDWFSTIAGNAVINLKMDPVPVSFERKDIKIVSTLVPFSSGSSSLPVYNYKCLRLLCERLYSLMDCYTQYTNTVSETEYDKTDLELAVTKVTFHRSDGISAVLMISGQSLYDTLEDMSDTDLHALHTSHSYGIKEQQTCEENPASCTDILTEFILDHSKLPVTPITSDLFHTVSSSMKEDDLPILIALAHAANISASSSFLKNLTRVAYQFYNSMTVMTLSVDIYSVWATKFVPKLYGHQRVWNSDNLDPLLMYVYPRLCIIKKSDHNHAAFYPPTDRRPDIFFVENIVEFVDTYFDRPESIVIETEEF